MSAEAWAVIAIAAVWRASHAIVHEEGPAGLFDWLQDRFDPAHPRHGWIGRGLRCMWCVSWWVGLAAAGWLSWFGVMPWYWTPLYGLAASAGAILIEGLRQLVADRLRR